MSAAQLITDYLTFIDILALVALAVFAVAAFYRRENLWLWLLGIVVLVWASSRILRLF